MGLHCGLPSSSLVISYSLDKSTQKFPKYLFTCLGLVIDLIVLVGYADLWKVAKTDNTNHPRELESDLPECKRRSLCNAAWWLRETAYKQSAPARKQSHS